MVGGPVGMNEDSCVASQYISIVAPQQYVALARFGLNLRCLGVNSKHGYL